MEIARIEVGRTTGICTRRGRIPARIVGASVLVSFTDPVWDKLIKTVAFRGKETRIAEFDGDVAVIPHEVIPEPGVALYFGIYGHDPDSDLQIPLIEVRLGTTEASTDADADPGAAPTLPIWAQLQKEIDEIKQQGPGPEGGGNAENGATFTPHVDEDGNLSWSNDKGLEDPETVNIKGKNGNDGITPHIGENGNWWIGEEDTGVSAGGQGSGGNVDQDQITAAVNEALAEAKASGEFDGAPGEKGDKGDPGAQGEPGKDGANGKDGSPGTPGADGITPHVGSNGNWFIGDNDTGIPTTGPAGGQGLPGTPGEDGKDGTSATHSWNGTVLTITSASGTSSADLKGAKGDKGDTGAKGDKGSQGIQGIPGEKGDKGNDGADGTVQIEPLFAESADWLNENGDTSKLYILPDNFVYGYFYKEGTGPAYTNRLPLATDTDRTTVLNGVGYVDGYRINSSGVPKDLSGCQLSGYIPVAQGDIIRIKNLQVYTGTRYNHMIAFYNSANTYVGSTYLNPAADMSGWADEQPGGITLSADRTEVTVDTSKVSDISACNAFRFMGVNMANVIVTVNEEIAEGGSVGGYGWYSTGHAFVPADYEDRIIALEKKVNTNVQSEGNAYLDSRNTYVMPVPGGYCESYVEYNANGNSYLSKYDFATMTAMFTAMATENPDYVTETVLGKDASGTYDIKQYVLDAPSTLVSGNTSAIKSEKPVFLITSGLHGLEPDAVHMVYHFMKDLCENHMESDHLEYLRNNVKFVIVPISNPWGYVNKNYHNSNDVDLNKNFECGYRNNGTDNTGTAAYSEAETVLLKGVFDTYKDAVFHLECHGKYGVDTSFDKTIWFSLMQSLSSELIELCADTITKQIGRRLYKLGYATNKSVGGYITYFSLNGRPKDYTGTKYGILSATMEGTGCIYGETGYSVNTQKINCEALENFVLRVMDTLDSSVKK